MCSAVLLLFGCGLGLCSVGLWLFGCGPGLCGAGVVWGFVVWGVVVGLCVAFTSLTLLTIETLV